MKIDLANPRTLALAVVLASAGALAFAYTSQYGFGLDPCALCFYQRKPYFVNIAVGLVAFLIAPKNIKIARALLVLAGLVFLTGAGIALFHVGVEKTWWKGLEACANYALPQNASIEDLQKFINSRSVVRCDVPAFVLFGISMAGYNFLLSSVLAIGTLWATLKKSRSV
jgi:disulfide bond formation protein DsbB